MAAILFLILRIILSITLYAFLFYLVGFLWVDFNQKGAKLVAYKVPILTLSIKSPPLQDRVEVFSKDDVLIGRDPDCDCQLQDDLVSSHHARCNFHHGQWWLSDLKSLNGTYIHNQRLTSSIVIVTGDEIQCGTLQLMVSISGDSSQTESLERGK